MSIQGAVAELDKTIAELNKGDRTSDKDSQFAIFRSANSWNAKTVSAGAKIRCSGKEEKNALGRRQEEYFGSDQTQMGCRQERESEKVVLLFF